MSLVLEAVEFEKEASRIGRGIRGAVERSSERTSEGINKVTGKILRRMGRRGTRDMTPELADRLSGASKRGTKRMARLGRIATKMTHGSDPSGPQALKQLVGKRTPGRSFKSRMAQLQRVSNNVLSREME